MALQQKQQVCIQLPMYADNMALSAFACRMLLLLHAKQQLIKCQTHISKPAAADLLL